MDRSSHDRRGGKPEATRRTPSARTTIATAIPGLRLVAISPGDADACYALVDRNRGHLTQHGDWTDLGEATRESLAASLLTSDEPPTQFGIWFAEQLIGRADLNPRTAGSFVLGYWLGSQFTGKGYATAACRAVIAYGKAELGATTIYAGVTKGNTKSEAVLGRLGFRAVADLGTYTRFRLSLNLRCEPGGSPALVRSSMSSGFSSLSSICASRASVRASLARGDRRGRQ